MLKRVVFRALLAFATVMALASPAHAYCEYRGVPNGKSSLTGEFRESTWVVRARVTRGRIYYRCHDCPGRLYDLEIISTYKGNLPGRFSFYTPQNSGGFYLNQGKASVGSEWLLFLNPGRWNAAHPKAARGATWVNYPCGQSQEWRTVGPKTRQRLLQLAVHRR